ncbi:MAG: YfhO family protein [Butyrivibrio sp.]|uniref:YfhO family protein n=1 Tax=Butyrivibrio sp. TaxID=28121 RepID=UPI0025F9152D|nr:YfhO family protein [Butyrivibrio sp.]MCR5770862.1 YfhO family protein [Butyrivibrio sp.]
MKKKSNILFTFIIYTFLYIIIMTFLYHFFKMQGKSLVYNGDGWRQHIRSMEYYSRWLHDLLAGIFTGADMPGTYAFSIGYGSDIISTLAYYGIGDPLVLPAAFIDSSKIIYLYSALILIRPYLAGLSFLLYCHTRIHYNRKISSDYSAPQVPVIIASAISYSFCGVVIYIGMLHPFFVIPLVVFPLILTGIERYLYDNKPSLLIFAIFISGISNYYFFYTQAILATAYFIFRLSYIVQKRSKNPDLFTDHKSLFKNESSSMFGLSVFLKAVVYVITGIGMSFITLLPVMIQFTQNSRNGIEYAKGLFYNIDYYKMLFANLLGFYNNPANDTELGLSAALIAGIIFMIIVKDHKRLKLTWFLTIILLIFPLFGKIFNGFSYSNNRWSYAIAMLAGWTLVSVFDDIKKSSKVQIILASVITLALVFTEYKLGYLVTDDTPIKRNVVFSIVLICICIALVLMLRSKFKIAGILVMAIAIISVTMNINFGYSSAQASFPQEFLDSMNPEEYTAASMNTEVSYVDSAVTSDSNQGISDNGIGRYSGIGKTLSLNYNASMPYGYSSTQFAFSLANGYISSYLNKLGIFEDQSFAYFGLDDRFIPMALANVRYDCANGYDDGQYMYVPYGFAEMTELSADAYPPAIKVFKNVLPLSAGITYSGYITESEFEEMNLAQRQEALTQVVVLPDDVAATIDSTSITNTDVTYTYQDLPYTITSCEGVTITDASGNDLSSSSGVTELNDLRIEAQSGSSITLTFDGLTGCETYLSFNDFYGNHGTDAVMQVQFEAYNGESLVTSKKLNYYTEYFAFRSDWHDYLVNFGYASSATSIKVNFLSEGSYSLDKLKVVCQPAETAVANLSAHLQYQITDTDLHLSNASYATDTITGNITTDTDKLMLISIPYSKGWSLMVDGIKTELYQADIMYMAAYVPSGDHSITLKYETPGLKVGALISILCFMIWLLVTIIPIAKENKKAN